MISSEKTVNDWIKYTLKNDQNMQVSILNFGGIITEINVPDREQAIENVVLTYKDIHDYKENPAYLGATIGRVAGRIANSRFSVANRSINLLNNEGAHHLHGGPNGLHQVVWDADTATTDEQATLTLRHTQASSVDGYPGNLDVVIQYTLTNSNEFIISYEAIADEDTVLTLTNHAYFNLSGNVKRTVHDHHVTMPSSEVIELDEQLLPTGKTIAIEQTPFDFRNGTSLSTGIQSAHEQNRIASNGYDHYFLLNKDRTIVVEEQISGRTMTIKTNQPGLVMYTGNTLPVELNLQAEVSGPYSGVTFETQATPASLEYPSFPSISLKANERYEKQTTFKFSTN